METVHTRQAKLEIIGRGLRPTVDIKQADNDDEMTHQSQHYIYGSDFLRHDVVNLSNCVYQLLYLNF